MRYGYLKILPAIAAVAAFVAVAPRPAVGQGAKAAKKASTVNSWTQPKTPWVIRTSREPGPATTASAPASSGPPISATGFT